MIIDGNIAYSLDYLQQCDAQLKLHDRNNNGIITVDEFIQSHNIKSDNYKDFAKMTNALINENKSVFQKYAGEDNNLTSAEYIALINSSEWEEIYAQFNELKTQFGIGAETIGENTKLKEDFSLAAFYGEEPLSVLNSSCNTLGDETCNFPEEDSIDFEKTDTSATEDDFEIKYKNTRSGTFGNSNKQKGGSYMLSIGDSIKSFFKKFFK